MRSLFTTPVDDLSFKDIKDFCAQGVPEGERVEYKEQFNEKIGQTIAAMANTDGGVILVGVGEDPIHKGLPGKIIGITEVRSSIKK